VPYITQNERKEMGIRPLADCTPANPGELQYAVAVLIRNYLALKPIRYQQLNDVLGALEGAKLEAYRCMVAPYENGKMAENGAVYPHTGGK